ncbi:MAG: hypothetical protein KGI54_09575 [Pseudomonadota bacterium]|nr:hypothetical protein [Pseudomonadota bacterium]
MMRQYLEVADWIEQALITRENDFNDPIEERISLKDEDFDDQYDMYEREGS